MQRFNLTFSGEILPGKAPAVVKARFGRLFGIGDPDRVEQFFSGKEIILRRNLDPREAAEFYARLRGLGALPALAKVAPKTTSPSEDSVSIPDNLSDTTATKSPYHNSRRAPNPYALRPFHDRHAPRRREAQALHLRRLGVITAAVALAGLFVLAVSSAILPPPAPPPQVIAGTSHDTGELVLATDQLLLRHDRSGTERDVTSLQEMGLSGIITALAYNTPDEVLLLVAQPSAATTLYRCSFSNRECQPVFGETATPEARAFARVTASGNLILADPTNNLLTLHSPEGRLLASAERQLPSQPVLRVEAGLLLINGIDAPSISVLRYEPEAFAEQLDEILLLPADAVRSGLSRTLDFSWVGDQWWVSMENPETGATGLFRYDSLWNLVAVARLPDGHYPQKLLGWKQKLLILDPEQTQVLRFNAQGQAEVPLQVNHLQNLLADYQEEQVARSVRGHLLLVALLMIALLGLGFAGWQRLRLRVCQSLHYRNAPLLGRHAKDIQWLPGAGESGLRLRHILQKLRVLPGHIGVLGQQLILVDHRGIYHTGTGKQLRWHPLFLMIDDVVLYTGPTALPEFDTRSWPLLTAALAEADRVDTATILVSLVAARHPLAVAGSIVLIIAVTVILTLAA
ncbi:hypothetical protein CWI75_11145 [Kineobactrum sediminis]|uniref:Uncharacterized protein n=1 Tax=Kineobactrum sediminis TaxID=1905677 RepID=A0A2N5Y1S4_9GAMM|nr:hypothetical protein [Kineobactrum sediminis]PLW82319.1 hypothetical protein CWI75_11145 [Kineobactrum sediminis]